MREIKFRAWNGVEMWEPRQLNDLFALDMYVDSKVSGNLIWMQYTGLKDKNGMEIYEGDVLSFPQEEQVISVKWDITHAGWQFDEHRGFDDGVGRGDWNFTLGIAKQCEIIGNIYENPELLNN